MIEYATIERCTHCSGKGYVNKWVQTQRNETAAFKPRGEYRDYPCPKPDCNRIPDRLLTEPTAEVIR